MKESDVSIVELEPMRVASVRAISETPENDSWKKMVHGQNQRASWQTPRRTGPRPVQSKNDKWTSG